MAKDMEYYIRISGEIMLKNLDRRKELTGRLLEKYLASGKRNICIVASGSSLNASITAEWFMNKYMVADVITMSPTEYMNYKYETVRDRFIILISQSGCSTNIIDAAKKMNSDNIEYATLTGNIQADLSRYAGDLIEYGVGNEVVDYVTLGMTTLIEFLILFAAETGRQSGFIADETYDDIIESIRKCCEESKKVYDSSVKFTERFYDNLLNMHDVMIISDGPNMGIAREASLKFGETLKVPALYFESEEYVHGPNMQLTPEYTIFFIDTNNNSDRMLDVFEATGLVTEHTYLITDKKAPDSEKVIRFASGILNEITPLVTVVLFQYISAHITKEKNDFKCHPAFDRFEEKIHSKTDDYEELIRQKIIESDKEE